LTFFNIGWRDDFVMRWWSAFTIGWPIAASTAYLAIPFARSLTQRIVAAIERTEQLLAGRLDVVFARRLLGTSHARLKLSMQLIRSTDQSYYKISFL
jgi:hypothetical protein